MRMVARYCGIVVIVIAVAWLTACDRVLSGPEQSAVLAFSEPATDNLLRGLSANDYTTFARDFDSDLQAELPATTYAAWKQELDTKLGSYRSRSVDHVAQSDEFYVVTYQVQFAQEDGVIVTVAFHVAQPHSITFLALDSEKASWSAYQEKR